MRAHPSCLQFVCTEINKHAVFLSYDTVEAFAVKRNPSLSFPFLKENGELISVAVNAGFLIEPRALDLYMDFYRNAEALTRAYPQYYRFTLGMILDLERGGIGGEEGKLIAEYVTEEDLVMFDTSDVRRLESLTMLKQVGALSSKHQRLYSDIIRRVDDFIQNPGWYTKFNKPLFYDLTHIVFFLTDFGKKPLPLKCDITPCLMHMGLLALLDNDADLLSEVGMCLSYINQDIPAYWDEYLTRYTDTIQISFNGTVASALNPSVDEYHLYLVSNAYLAGQNKTSFKEKFRSKTPSFSIEDASQSLLSQLSEYAHRHKFQQSRKPHTIEIFTSNLAQEDLPHWDSSLASCPLSHTLIREFSNLN